MGEEQGTDAAAAGPGVTHVPDRQRYEIAADDERAGYAAYVDAGEQRIFYHTEIDPQFSGRGLAGSLVAAALTDTRQAGGRVVAVCPFVAKYLQRHHEFDDILDPVTSATLDTVRASARG